MALTPKVKKRNGSIADFIPHNITVAVQKAFAATLGEARESEAIAITRAVVDAIDLKFGGTAFIPTVEDIQDLVENALMQRGYFTVAKSYIIYRYEHAKERQQAREAIAEKIEENQLLIEKRDGTKENFNESKLTRTLTWAVQGYEGIIDTSLVIA
ncbi:MAG TPA: ATP cone domain-containing protein, partial [Candidatus Paceibacterota bacterium]